MITKIVSGGQTGADRAALDVAIEEGIPHGGWIPKGRLTEAGPLPEKYKLKELPTDSYPERTERNVIDSDGTLIISHGELKGGSALTREFANKYARPSLQIDLDKLDPLKAAQEITTWITDHEIKVLNVAGPRASHDPRIYEAVKDLLKSVLYLDYIWSFSPDSPCLNSRLPGTVDEAVQYLESQLTLKDKAMIAKMTERELTYLHPTLGQYVRNNFGLWAENKKLIQSCRLRSCRDLDEDECSAFIVKELWERLRISHRLEIVK
jgi:hypothetical protein